MPLHIWQMCSVQSGTTSFHSTERYINLMENLTIQIFKLSLTVWLLLDFSKSVIFDMWNVKITEQGSMDTTP